MHPEWIDTAGKFDWIGDDLFFLLSGYLISSQLYQQITNIATLSFAVYLTHKGIFHVSQIQLTRLGIAMDGNLMLLLCTFNCFFAAFLLNRIIEQPFLKLRKRILSAS